jgi:hypothetical protein
MVGESIFIHGVIVWCVEKAAVFYSMGGKAVLE